MRVHLIRITVMAYPKNNRLLVNTQKSFFLLLLF